LDVGIEAGGRKQTREKEKKICPGRGRGMVEGRPVAGMQERSGDAQGHLRCELRVKEEV
jgi:hypothetical protein